MNKKVILTWYYLIISLLSLSIVFFIISQFISKLKYVYIVCIIIAFLLCFFVGFVEQFNHKTGLKISLSNSTKIEKISFYLLAAIAFPVSTCIFIYLMILQGGPEIINGSYFIVNHGDIIKEITLEQYKILYFLEQVMFVLSFNVTIYGLSMTIRNLILNRMSGQ